MPKLPAIHLYPGDWLRDPVSGVSLAAQGLWLRMMFLMHDSERYGYLSQNGRAIVDEVVARRVGADSLDHYRTLLAELDSVGIPSRTSEGIIYSRRMVRDSADREDSAERKRKSRLQSQGCHSFVTPSVTPSVTAQSRASPEDEDEDEKQEGGSGGKPSTPWLDRPQPERWGSVQKWLGQARENGADYSEAEAKFAFLRLEAAGWKIGSTRQDYDWRLGIERQIQNDRRYAPKEKTKPTVDRNEGTCQQPRRYRGL